MGIVKLFLLILAMCIGRELLAQNSQLDSTFGVNGKVVVEWPVGQNFSLTGIQITNSSQGKFLVSGFIHNSVDNVNSRMHYILLLINGDGSIDRTFGENGFYSEDIGEYNSRPYPQTPMSPSLQLDGRIVFSCPYYSGQEFNSRILVRRLLPSGQVDQSFGENGKVLYKSDSGQNYPNGAIVLRDGSILVAANIGPSTINSPTLIKFRGDGSLAQEFGVDGKCNLQLPGISSFSRMKVIETEFGELLIGGNTSNHMFVGKLSSAGSYMTEFGNGGAVICDFSRQSSLGDIVILSNKKIMVAGKVDSASIVSYFAVAMLNEDGTYNSGFASGLGRKTIKIGTSYSNAASIIQQKSGQINLIGNSVVAPLFSNVTIVSIDSSGKLDTNFNDDGIVIFDGLAMFQASEDALLLDNGKTLIAGHIGSAFLLMRTKSDICGNSSIEGGQNRIVVKGITASKVTVAVRSLSNSGVDFTRTYENIQDSLEIPSIVSGQYSITMIVYSASSTVLCEITKTVSVTNSPLPPEFSVTNIIVDESQGTAHIQVCTPGVILNPASVIITTVDSSAKAGVDYVYTRDTIYFPGPFNCWSIDIPLINNTIPQSDRYFKVVLSNPVGALLKDSVALIKITDDDSNIAYCDSVKVLPQSRSISVQGLVAPRIILQVSNNSWASVFNQSYTNSPGTVTIPNLAPGKYYVSVIFMQSDWTGICNREFYDVTVTDSVAIRPSITLSDISVDENAGVASVTICVRNAGQDFIRIGNYTVNGTAIGDRDFTSIPAGGSLTFNKDDSCRTIQIPITDDGETELNETFSFVITSISGEVDLLKPTAVITIVDNDQNGSPCADMSINPGPGNIQINNLVAPIALVQVSTSTWSVVYSEIHRNFNGNLTIPSLSPGLYFVKITLFDANWQAICVKETPVTVSATNSLPFVNIAQASASENAGTVSIPVCLSRITDLPVTVTYSTSDLASAIGNIDYVASTGTITIPAGQLCGNVIITLKDDIIPEPNEGFVVYITNVVNARHDASFSGVAILNDDICPPGAICTTNVCPSVGANLSTLYNIGTLPPGAEITWHTGPVATTSNRILSPIISLFAEGAYFAAIHVPGSECYSGTKPILIYHTTCLTLPPPTRTINARSEASPADATVELQIKAIPNPFSEGISVLVESPLEGKAEVSLLEMTGRVITTKTIVLTKGDNSVSLSGLSRLASGSYFVRVRSAQGQKTTLVVKQN